MIHIQSSMQANLGILIESSSRRQVIDWVVVGLDWSIVPSFLAIQRAKTYDIDEPDGSVTHRETCFLLDVSTFYCN